MKMLGKHQEHLCAKWDTYVLLDLDRMKAEKEHNSTPQSYLTESDVTVHGVNLEIMLYNLPYVPSVLHKFHPNHSWEQNWPKPNLSFNAK